LSRVVSNLLDMSRIQAGALVMDSQPVSLDELFASVLEAVGQRASRLKISLGSQPVVVVVVVDRALLVEALVNVVENALRYAPEASTMELAGSLDPADSHPVRVAVTDRGPGIPQSLRAQLFNDYPSSTAERALPERGAGLGLAIAQALM
jgi:two-component system sensor histidine kinase KdpD